MRWEKRGQILSPAIMSENGLYVHSQNPVPVELDDRIRIFFACRPEHTISIPTYIDVDKDNPSRILCFRNEALLELGDIGAFDEFGIIPTEIVRRDNELWMYYTGWQRGVSYTYTLSIGLAVSTDNGKSFSRKFSGPVIDRTKDEPYMTMAPFIFNVDGTWHAFYASGIGFQLEAGKNEPVYVIKHRTSADGVQWTGDGKQLFPQKTPYESNTRPAIIKKDGYWHMWFCYRGASDYRGGRNSYKIGYAYSENLLSWTRGDNSVGIGLSESGWDSEIITYPYIRKIKDKYLMFYNGNGFGATGFGYAELVE